MTTYWDEVVLDAAELRDAASTIRDAGSNFAELASRLPIEVPDAPWWVAEQVGDELWRIRAECAELTDEFASAARELELRAAEVESSDRTYDLVDGRLRSCCRLADGTIVTLANETAGVNADAMASLAPMTIGASAVGEAAWGSGGGFTTIGASAVGEAAWGSGGGFTTIGGGIDLGGGTGGGFTTIGGGVDVTIPNVEIPGLDQATISGGATRITPIASTSQPFPSPYSGVPGPYGVMANILNAGTWTDALVNF